MVVVPLSVDSIDNRLYAGIDSALVDVITHQYSWLCLDQQVYSKS